MPPDGVPWVNVDAYDENNPEKVARISVGLKTWPFTVACSPQVILELLDELDACRGDQHACRYVEELRVSEDRERELRTNRDSLVSCGTCFREEYVNFQACLQLGWPKCCGYTMRLGTTEANIEKATVGAITSQKKQS